MNKIPFRSILCVCSEDYGRNSMYYFNKNKMFCWSNKNVKIRWFCRLWVLFVYFLFPPPHFLATLLFSSTAGNDILPRAFFWCILFFSHCVLFCCCVYANYSTQSSRGHGLDRRHRLKVRPMHIRRHRPNISNTGHHRVRCMCPVRPRSHHNRLNHLIR